MTVYGYSRISSDSQLENSSLFSQREELMKQGVLSENIFEEVCSANDLDRPTLQNLLETVKTGDTILVVRMDRFARSTLSALNLIKDLEERGISFKSLDIPECENPLFLEFFRIFILFFARWEQSIRRERQLSGIARAKAEKKYKGRKPKINEKLLENIKERLFERNYKKADIYKSLGVSRTTFYKALKVLNEEKKSGQE